MLPGRNKKKNAKRVEKQDRINKFDPGENARALASGRAKNSRVGGGTVQETRVVVVVACAFRAKRLTAFYRPRGLIKTEISRTLE